MVVTKVTVTVTYYISCDTKKTIENSEIDNIIYYSISILFL